MVVTSGWRSRAHQQRLLAEAVSRYGSEEEARRYVSTPDTSAHVTGDAVDIGPTDGASWLSQHGSDYGLCQIFANEIWHYELATTPGRPVPRHVSRQQQPELAERSDRRPDPQLACPSDERAVTGETSPCRAPWLRMLSGRNPLSTPQRTARARLSTPIFRYAVRM